MSTVVSIHLSKTLHAGLRRSRKEAGQPAGAERALREVVTKYRLKPEPLFPDDRGPTSEYIWHAAVADHEAAKVVEELLRIPGVEGAYVKPPEQPPSPP